MEWRAVDDVLGRSALFPLVGVEARNTLSNGARRMVSVAACGPNIVELRLASLSRFVDLETAVKDESISAEKASHGYVSVA